MVSACSVDRTNERTNEHMFETLGIVQLACKHANFVVFFLLKRTSYCCAVQCKGLTWYGFWWRTSGRPGVRRVTRDVNGWA